MDSIKNNKYNYDKNIDGVKIINKINEKINFEELSEEFFFKNLVQKYYEKNFIDINFINNINFQRMEILKLQLEYYTKNESSSVLKEEAEKILDGIDYSIGIYLKKKYEQYKKKKESNEVELILDKLKKEKLSYMQEEGYRIIKRKKERSEVRLLNIKNNKLKINNYFYNDTIDYQLSGFLKKYDSRFIPQEVVEIIDYRVATEYKKYIGIEYIEQYIYVLNLENEFCRKFSEKEINMLLKGYDEGSELLLINVFELIITNLIGKIIAEEDVDNLDITKNQQELIKNKLEKMSVKQLEENMISYSENLIYMLQIKSEILKKYITKVLIKLIPWIYSGVQHDNLKQIFISFREIDENNTIYYEDKEKMSDSKFKRVITKISECSLVGDKIYVIKENIKSLQDLVDMLDSECLIENELERYFQTLSEIEIILLFKHMNDFGLLENHQKEWQYRFKGYIHDMEESKYSLLMNYSKKIIIV